MVRTPLNSASAVWTSVRENPPSMGPVSRQRATSTCTSSPATGTVGASKNSSATATDCPGSTTSTNPRSEEHTSELQSLMRISYAVFCLKKKKNTNQTPKTT